MDPTLARSSPRALIRRFSSNEPSRESEERFFLDPKNGFIVSPNPGSRQCEKTSESLPGTGAPKQLEVVGYFRLGDSRRDAGATVALATRVSEFKENNS